MIAATSGWNKRHIRCAAIGGTTSTRTALGLPSRGTRADGTKISFAT